MAANALPASIDATASLLVENNYVADRSLATAVFLALKLQRPLFLEGEPGTGKTEIAKVLAVALGAELIRLQCYEGLDIHGAAYEWNYAQQMLEIRLAEAAGESRERIAQGLFTERFLIERPLLASLRPRPHLREHPPVLLIDEIDRADEPFEAYLLEVLADFQITIPEWKTVKADRPPVVVITSNRTREVHDAVKRRCLYHWVDYPSAARELEILRRRVPDAQQMLSRQVVAFVQELRRIELYKLPGVAETIEWTRALLALDAVVLEPETVNNTLGVLLKYQDDIAKMQGSEAARLLERVRNDALVQGSA
jgi:MoxR-like ATPase